MGLFDPNPDFSSPAKPSDRLAASSTISVCSGFWSTFATSMRWHTAHFCTTLDRNPVWGRLSTGIQQSHYTWILI